MTYPVGDELAEFLVSCGMLSNGLTDIQKFIDFDGAMSAASAEFERLTGYLPFLSSGTEQTRVFDGPGCSLLQLRSGLLSMSSLVINTVTYTVNQQFVLQPTDAPERGLPYTYLDFGSGWNSGDWNIGSEFQLGAGSLVGLGTLGSGRRAISVTGVWGFCLTLPADVRQALLSWGAARVAPRLMHSITGGLKQQKAGNDSWTWSESMFSAQINAWKCEMTEVANRPGYRLFRL